MKLTFKTAASLLLATLLVVLVTKNVLDSEKFQNPTKATWQECRATQRRHNQNKGGIR